MTCGLLQWASPLQDEPDVEVSSFNRRCALPLEEHVETITRLFLACFPFERECFMSRTNFEFVSTACLVVLAIIGCDAAAPTKGPATQPTASNTAAAPVSESQTATTEDKPSHTPDATASSAPALNLQEKNWEQVKAFVAEHKGKVVVVDVWSTSCEPCLAEFPHLVALQKQYADDVVCVSFDCDFIGAKNKPVAYYRERVLTALTDMKAESIHNMMSTTPADELFIEMDIDSIPAVYVFDREGKLSKRFDNRTPVGGGIEGISYEKQINPLVAELVKAPAP